MEEEERKGRWKKGGEGDNKIEEEKRKGSLKKGGEEDNKSGRGEGEKIGEGR